MSAEARIQPFPEGSSFLYDRLQIATDYAQQCLDKPDEVVEGAKYRMLLSRNQPLLSLTIDLSVTHAQRYGGDTQDYFQRGASVAFFYFSEVAEKLTQQPLPVISGEMCEVIGRQAVAQRYQRRVVEEFSSDDELAAMDQERTTQILKTLDKALLYASLCYVSEAELRGVAASERMGFLNGVTFIDNLFADSQEKRE